MFLSTSRLMGISKTQGDPFFANTTLLMHMNGSNNGTVFTDQIGATATRNGSPITSTTQFKYGGSSMRAAGADYLSFAPTSNHDLGTGDFTLEGWWRFDDLNDHSLLAKYANGNAGWLMDYINSTNSLRLALANGTDNLYSFTLAGLTANTWVHLAITRTGSSIRGFMNGTLLSTAAVITNNVDATGTGLNIGKANAFSRYLRGYVDDVRITKGVSRYTASFIPPASQFPDN